MKPIHLYTAYTIVLFLMIALVHIVHNPTWDVVIVCVGVFVAWLIWEIDNAPLMPDDYDERLNELQ